MLTSINLKTTTTYFIINTIINTMMKLAKNWGPTNSKVINYEIHESHKADKYESFKLDKYDDDRRNKFHRTYPGDSWTNYLLNPNKVYACMTLMGLGCDNSTCELCPKHVSRAVAVQVHKSWKPTGVYELLSPDELRPVLLVFTCDEHSNSESFYKLTNGNRKSFLIISINAAPGYAKWQIMESIIEEEVRTGHGSPIRHRRMREKIAKLKKEEIKMLKAGKSYDGMPDLMSSSSDEDPSDEYDELYGDMPDLEVVVMSSDEYDGSSSDEYDGSSSDEEDENES